MCGVVLWELVVWFEVGLSVGKEAGLFENRLPSTSLREIEKGSDKCLNLDQWVFLETRRALYTLNLGSASSDIFA